MRQIFDFALDIFSPKPTFIQKLEKMDAEEMYKFLKNREAENPSFKKRSRLPSGLNALFSYSDPFVRTIIWEIKYRKNKTLTDKVGYLLYREILKKVEIATGAQKGCAIASPDSSANIAIILSPVPASQKRLRKRGFNQSELICESIARHFSATERCGRLEYISDVIRKIKETRHQADLIKKERLVNVIGSFAVIDPEHAKGKNFIIIDDVITTGGTVNEICRILLRAGAKSVTGLAIAH